jgi:hypothetical protein
MKRLIEKMVFSGLVDGWPQPLSALRATTDGVVRVPSLVGDDRRLATLH